MYDNPTLVIYRIRSLLSTKIYTSTMAGARLPRASPGPPEASNLRVRGVQDLPTPLMASRALTHRLARI
ncbi:MAG: hypothetical protein CVU65_09315 [Deltaproteobacteria bacterium HGW-Deltaproteobacteria-22]|nr:MAG: hypothetical protein CVU65_09315 [Deltaproteobacteria bacterium HGW-Deltaproteobacteria-22]